MPNKVHIQQFPHGQFMVTIPRALAQALDIEKGETVQWSVEHGGLLLRRLR